MIIIPIYSYIRGCKAITGAIRHYKILSLTRRGIWFYYKGDEVLWRWWWNRQPKQPKNYIVPQQGKYVSTLCEGCFNSLLEMDNFWKQYQDYCNIEERK